MADLRTSYRWRGRQRDSAHVVATDLVLGNDSLRLGIVQRIEFDFRDSTPIAHPDYLILLPWGTARSTVAPGQANVGAIGGRTVFRVGRRHYYVESLDSTRSKLVIRHLENPGSQPLTAELDRQLRAVPVRTLEGEASTISAHRGKVLVLYFWSLGSQRSSGSDVRRIDSLYRALPPARREQVEVVLINRVDAVEPVRKFLAERPLDLPVYLAAPNTCRRLNCSPLLPYWIDVDEAGRIRSYDRPPEELAEVLR